MEIRDRLKMLQEAKKMTQKEFAKLLGIAEGSLSGIYLGRTNPTNNHTMAVHRALPDVNINWLLFGEGEMYAGQSQADGGDFPSLFSQPAAENTISQAAFQQATQPVVPQEADAQKPERSPEVIRRNVSEIRVFFDDGTYETFVHSQQ